MHWINRYSCHKEEKKKRKERNLSRDGDDAFLSISWKAQGENWQEGLERSNDGGITRGHLPIPISNSQRSTIKMRAIVWSPDQHVSEDAVRKKRIPLKEDQFKSPDQNEAQDLFKTPSLGPI